jgi:glutathione S-transferase
MNSGEFTLADLVPGEYARRWYSIDGDIEWLTLPNVERWYARIAERVGFQNHIAVSLG